MLSALMAWLATLPPGTLYLMAGGLAAFENVFPPFPSDVIVAFLVFLAARMKSPYWAPALSIWVGSTSGAMLMYYVGRRYGSLLLLEKLERVAGKDAGVRLQAMYARYGGFALFISRFIPGVRAVVPPFAGAMRLPAWQVLVSMGVAGGLWYAFVAYLAYEAGENWSLLVTHLRGTARVIGLAASGLAAAAGAFWYLRHHKTVDQDGG